jgi:hypothetical protein
MRRTIKTKSEGRTIALALTWDGARWPVRSLPREARAFLRGPEKSAAVPAAGELSALFFEDGITEIRVCWVPRLKGGGGTLSEPFQTPSRKRIPFRAVKTARFGEALGVVYRRNRVSPARRKTA